MRRKEKSTGKFFSIFVVVIMTASVLGFLIGGRDGNEQTLEYNGFEFVRKGNEWMVLLNNKQLFFDYYPEQVLDIKVNKEIPPMLGNLEVDITYNVNTSNVEAIALSQYRIKNNLEKISNVYIRQGLTGENEFYLPIITCEDSTEAVPVIYFKESNETKIYNEGNCIIIEADSETNFLRAKDRLMYGFFEIIK